jgi:SagB-type dehydrogenase family enzyme
VAVVRIERPRQWDHTASLSEAFGTLADAYHSATRNPGATKGLYKAHEVHYSPYVQQLAVEAPLHLDDLPRVALPVARAPVPMPIDEAITHRASGRRYGPDPLPAEHLATLLYLGNGVREVVRIGGEVLFYQRNVTNSGNLGSVEIFPLVMNVAGIAPGIYHFDSVRHDLARIHSGQFRTWLMERVLFQREFPAAAVALILTSAIGRLQAKYGPRGYRFGLFDVGHVSENIYLVGTGLALQVCATAGFIDEEVDRTLGFDGLERATMLVLLIGPAHNTERAVQGASADGL